MKNRVPIMLGLFSLIICVVVTTMSSCGYGDYPSNGSPSVADSLYHSLPEGRIAFNTPNKMTKGESTIIELILSPAL